MTTYREAGVDIDAGEETVRRIKPLVRQTFTRGVLADIGAFGAFFQLDTASFKQPVLVSSLDGVGTKLKVAFMADRHDSVGQDLVNHCVNDIAVCGAKPLFFLDYFSTGKLIPDVAEQIVRGFSTACKENGCALIGGETAEMPDLYADGEYDLSGTIIGLVEKDNIVDGRSICAGDDLIGIPSTGLHTNGYSLARKVLFSRFGVSDRPDALNGRTIGDELLRVHRSYLNTIQHLIQTGCDIRGMVHVTGGGIPGNTRRVIPEGLDFSVDYSAWERPSIFRLIQDLGSVPEDDMRRTFNLGMGLILIAGHDDTSRVVKECESLGERPIRLGKIFSI
ncbi:MAG: phosphoribosylformylglycinamidine cyclo-ligase [Bacteroidetes bacterium]|nr:phosphoribosylformylglycinamidine cyclo-ligase [Bacteroidota bacterium]